MTDYDSGAITITPANQLIYTAHQRHDVLSGGGSIIAAFHITHHAMPIGLRCNGECDWHPILCSDTEGITAPGPLGGHHINCPDCLRALETKP
mgnify:CR=1 FL=1